MARNTLMILLCAACMVGLGAPAASATSLKPIVLVTIKDGPIALPGTVLQPGKYAFRLADTLGTVMQVQTAAGRQIGFFPVLTVERRNIGRLRLDVSHGKTSMERIKDLYFTGDDYGYAFEYPKKPATAVTKPRP